MSSNRWLFAFLGWAAVGPIGALLGFAIGKSIDSRNKYKQIADDNTPHRGPYRNTGTVADLNAALLVLIAAVMKGDGVVRRSELEHVKAFLRRNYSEQHAKEMLGLLHELNQRDHIDVDAICQQIKVNTSYTTRYQMFDFLYALAATDGEVSRGETLVLNNIRNGLAISASDALSIAQRHTPSAHSSSSARSKSSTHSSSDDYRTLGIAPTATDDEVKRAYRRMAMKYHPDKVATLGEEVRKNAETQFRLINEAYERIRTARGMK